MATVPIIGGTGALGFGLALRLAAAGEHGLGQAVEFGEPLFLIEKK